MNRLVLVSLTSLVLLGLAAPAAAGVHKDDKLGYQVSTPTGWPQIPVAIREKWIVAKYLSDKDYRTTEDDWTIEFKPDMRVIVFPFAVTKRKGPKKDKITAPDGTEIEVFSGFDNPYKDYKDYLKQNYSGGGWFIEMEEEKSKKDLDWTLWEINVEKLARSGKKRIVAGIFHAGDADFVVQFEVLADSYDKLRNTIYGCLNSFKFIERTGPLVEDTKPDVRFVNEGELTPREREKRRYEGVVAAFEKAKAGLPRDWTSFEYKGKFLVLSHVDGKTAAELLNPGLAVWMWLDKSFAYLGDEYVRPLIVRICATSEEADAYGETSRGGWWSSAYEEVVLYDRDTSSGFTIIFGWGGLPGRVTSNWFHDKDRDLYYEFPSWLKNGLQDLFGSAKIKGSKLEFPRDSWDVRDLAVAAHRGELKPVRELLQSTWSGFGGHFSAQSSAFVRFLLIGAGRRLKLTKDFLEVYLQAVREIAHEEEKKREEEMKNLEPEKKEGPKTEEEEEEEFRKRRKGTGDGGEWQKREQEVLKRILERAFGDWTDKDWDLVDRAYRATLLK